MAPSAIAGAGLGLFASADLRKNTLLGKYAGEELTAAQTAARYGTDSKGCPAVPPQYVLLLPGQRYIDASDPSRGNALRYINHAPAKQANCRYTEAGNVRTTKAVKAGSELLANYNRGHSRFLRRHGLADDGDSAEPPPLLPRP